MLKFISIVLGVSLIFGSIYLFLEKPAPEKYIELVEKTIPKPKIEPMKLLFVGDMMLDRGIRNTIAQNGFDYIFEDLKAIFSNRDLVIGNLEGTITSNLSVSVIDNKILHFTFATSSAMKLKEIGFNGFSLANNHALDFYQKGYDETTLNLENAGLFSFGHPLNNQNLSNIQIVKNQNVCFVGYHSLYDASTTNITNEIVKLRPSCSYLVVFSHWGVEYEDFENEIQRNAAHEFIDNGADLVIGAHPHVIEPIEIYKNKAIFYSLGNLVFDQDFSIKTREGIAVSVEVGKEKVNFEIIPIEITKGKLTFIPKEEFSRGLEILSSKLQPNLQKSLYEGLKFELAR